jgi:hypothetical protein
MKRVIPFAALLLAGELATVSALAQQPQTAPADKLRAVTVFGKDPCPRGAGDEVVICARRPESERYRIPPNLRELPVSPDNESWSRKAERLEMVGRTGIQSCSPVGPAGGTGCLLELIKQAREEREAAARERAKAP